MDNDRGPSISSEIIEDVNPEGLEQALKIFAQLLVKQYIRRRREEHATERD